MSLAFIGLGSNLGDGRRNLKRAWHQVGNHPEITILTLSSPYLTRPVNKKEWQKKGEQLADQLFTNAAGVLETRLSPNPLLKVLKDVESAMGRDSSKTVDRPVDLDILYFDELALSEADLDIPHPEISKRPFVLIPLAEIAPDHQHPVNGLTTRQMIRNLTDYEAADFRKIAWQDTE